MLALTLLWPATPSNAAAGEVATVASTQGFTYEETLAMQQALRAEVDRRSR